MHTCVSRRNLGVFVCAAVCADDVVNGFRVYVHKASRHLKPIHPVGVGRENGETRPP